MLIFRRFEEFAILDVGDPQSDVFQRYISF